MAAITIKAAMTIPTIVLVSMGGNPPVLSAERRYMNARPVSICEIDDG
jgi:hypothetical protein